MLFLVDLCCVSVEELQSIHSRHFDVEHEAVICIFKVDLITSRPAMPSSAEVALKPSSVRILPSSSLVFSSSSTRIPDSGGLSTQQSIYFLDEDGAINGLSKITVGT